MKPILIAALLGLTIVPTLQAQTLKKQRDWPASIKVPDAALKEQYEYDPAAGAISAKLLSTTQTFKGNAVLRQYSNGAPAGGSAGWADHLYAYHGFAAISSGSGMRTRVVKFQSSGAWPAKSFKVYSEVVADSGLNIRVLTQCELLASFPAAQALDPKLPGKIHKFDCKTQTLSEGVVDGMQFDKNAETYPGISYYSDYLDVVIDGRSGLDTPLQQQLEFLDASGQRQTISFTGDGASLP